MIDRHSLNQLIQTALREDWNTGDITTMSTVQPGTVIKGNFIAKAEGILCGIDVAKAVFAYVDAGVKLDANTILASLR